MTDIFPYDLLYVKKYTINIPHTGLWGVFFTDILSLHDAKYVSDFVVSVGYDRFCGNELSNTL